MQVAWKNKYVSLSLFTKTKTYLYIFLNWEREREFDWQILKKNKSTLSYSPLNVFEIYILFSLKNLPAPKYLLKVFLLSLARSLSLSTSLHFNGIIFTRYLTRHAIQWTTVATFILIQVGAKKKTTSIEFQLTTCRQTQSIRNWREESNDTVGISYR